ncbi:hypothetical protein D8674_022030 [Pyrus ussuriensis x Pyrus communis]|uniref:Uncharacterized protein n=1 Tax=Pyrus ussuriensis x Pyrus communis TaxID=2448454 RepID=A0A5N5GP88_9ROSA|nr:hypothetical protein D8674_022030 [Pyrus ussuriensis x Pyrus communis]
MPRRIELGEVGCRDGGRKLTGVAARRARSTSRSDDVAVSWVTSMSRGSLQG